MARDDEAHAGNDVPSSGRALPGHYDLQLAVAEVRRRGVGNLDKPLLDLDTLLAVARIVSSKEDDAEKIEDALERAARCLRDTPSTDAVLALLGLTSETRGRGAGFRRGIAAKHYKSKTPESFRSHNERELLMAVATFLLVLVDKQRLADRERRLAEQQATLIKAQESLVEAQTLLIENYLPTAQLRHQVLQAMMLPSDEQQPLKSGQPSATGIQDVTADNKSGANVSRVFRRRQK